jgi:ATP-binding protein involved in chromosome partitioning
MFRKVNVPVLGLVENMSSFICPHCGEPSNIFGHGGARAEAARLGVPFLGEVPLTLAVRETSDEGRPIVATDHASPAAQAFREIAAHTLGELERSKGQARQAPRIVVES